MPRGTQRTGAFCQTSFSKGAIGSADTNNYSTLEQCWKAAATSGLYARIQPFLHRVLIEAKEI